MAVTHEALIESFRREGRQLWLGGGALRDRFLGLESKDVDYATDADPDLVEALLRSLGATITTVGKRFGTIGVLVTSGETADWSEITTFRGDSYSAGTRWPDVTFGTTIEEDLARRDFTINALAEDAFTQQTLDLFEGERDLADRLIRAVLAKVLPYPARFRTALKLAAVARWVPVLARSWRSRLPNCALGVALY